MRKGLFLTSMVCCVLFAVSCSDDDEPSKDTLGYLREDYNKMLAIYGNADNGTRYDLQGHFTSAVYVLNASPSETPVEELHPASVVYSFYFPPTGDMPGFSIHGKRYFNASSMAITYKLNVDTPWNTNYIGYGLFDSIISLEDAVRLVKQANVPDLDDTDVTLSWPVNDPPFAHPVYTFCAGNKDIYIDAFTGQILE